MFKEKRKINIVALQRVSRRDEIPASLFQEDVFLNHLAQPENVSINVVSLYEIEGCDDESLFCQTYDEVVKKHEVFRTAFKLGNDKVYQVITPIEEFKHSLTVANISHLGDSDQNSYLLQFARDNGYAPFDLQKAPLFRAKLFRLGQNRYVLFRVAHHSIIDLTSMGIFCNEVAELYDAKCQNTNAQMLEPKFHFADYSVWERNTLSDETLKTQFDYWREVYSDASDINQLPFDFERPSIPTQNFEMLSIDLSLQTWTAVKQLARITDASLFQTNMGIFAIFLNQHYNHDDFFIGSSIDMRRARGLNNLFGPLVSEFAIRCKFNPEITPNDFIKNLKVQSIKAYQNSDISYEKLLTASGLKRKLNTYSLYQLEFSLRSHNESNHKHKINFKEIFWESGTGDVELTCRINEKINGATIIFRYSADLFRQSTIKDMLQKFAHFYDDIIPRIDQKIFESSPKALKKTHFQPQIVEVDDSKKIYLPPLTPFEKTVAKIWQEALGLNRVSRDGNFFELGGGLYQLLKVYREMVALDFNLRFDELYNYPTISSLAEYLQNSDKDNKRKTA